MDPQSNQLPQQPTDSTPGAVPPTPPQPGQQFAPGPQPGVVMPGGQPQPQPFQQPAPASQPFQPQPTPQQPFAPSAQPGQPFTPQPDGGYPTGMPVDQSNKKKLRLIVLLVTILVVAALAAVSYFAFFKKDNSGSADKAAQKSSDSSENKDAIDLATLSGLTMSLAQAPNGFTAKTDPAPGAKQYSYASADGKETCELLFGTVSAESLPGANLDAIVKPQLDQLRQLGATVEGPSAGTALVLKDSGGSDSYRMPTLDFKFTYQGNEAVVHYSAVILTSGERAVVNRTCAQEGGSVNMDRLKSLDGTAKNIVVTKK